MLLQRTQEVGRSENGNLFAKSNQASQQRGDWDFVFLSPKNIQIDDEAQNEKSLCLVEEVQCPLSYGDGRA